MDRKFKVGDKVVPHDCTFDLFSKLNNSGVWWSAIKKKQPFLYVLAVDKQIYTGQVVEYVLSDNMKDETGDFFMECDLTEYKE